MALWMKSRSSLSFALFDIDSRSLLSHYQLRRCQRQPVQLWEIAASERRAARRRDATYSISASPLRFTSTISNF
jgi:hypothetical protein